MSVVTYISYVYSQSHSTVLTNKHSVLPLQTILTNQYACPHVHHSLYDRHPRHYDSAPRYQRLPHAVLERRGKRQIRLEFQPNFLPPQLSAKQLATTDELMQSEEKLSVCEREKGEKDAAVKEVRETLEASRKLNEGVEANLETCRASLQTAKEEAKKAEEIAKSAEAEKAAEAERMAEAEKVAEQTTKTEETESEGMKK